MCVAVVEVTLRVFGVIQRECVNPSLCAGLALVPVVQRAVLKVTQGFVCVDSEGRTSHGQGVTVQQRRVVVQGAQYPTEHVIKHCKEPEHQGGHADPPEVKCGEEQHVKILVALVG